MDLIPQGLVISALGIVTAFVAMASFILIIVVLKRLFPVKTEAAETGSEAAMTVEMDAGDDDYAADAALVVAIAAALATARARAQSTLGADLGAGRGAWWSARLMGARQGKPTKK
ncbi:MAG: hypothetical protein HPY76_07225 [Anaerolineae bacterium]|nr:hypothetical protein [Anaerolineae bacterium]